MRSHALCHSSNKRTSSGSCSPNGSYVERIYAAANAEKLSLMQGSKVAMDYLMELLK